MHRKESDCVFDSHPSNDMQNGKKAANEVYIKNLNNFKWNRQITSYAYPISELCFFH